MNMAQWRLNRERGISLIEVLIAVSIFSMVATAGVGVFISSARLEVTARERHAAYQFAASGLEAVRNIKDEDFLLLEDGTHGLEVSEDVWNLNSNSNEQNGYTREIGVVEIDDEVKEVTARVIWESRFGPREIVLTTQFTDWEKQTEMALDADVNIGGAYVFSKGSKNLLGITIENIGDADIMLGSITVAWTPDTKRKLNAITIDGALVWSNSGPGSPSKNQPPGAVTDIVDVLLPAGGGPINIDSFDFNGNMKDNVFDLTFTMIDGSEVIITNIVPPVI